ncbi:unnamed protein product [Effrenium voratum]|nr:unnamed protein product [Effrenium voratum]
MARRMAVAVVLGGAFAAQWAFARTAACKASVGECRSTEGSFRVVAREPGSVRPDIPVFTSEPGLLRFRQLAPTKREELPDIPGAFVLHDAFSEEECQQLIELTEQMGYTEDAPVSLGRNIRHNENCVWIADEETSRVAFERCADLLPNDTDTNIPVGINRRWRFYKYNVGDIFRPHLDGSWAGSGIDSTGNLVHDIFGDRWSKMSWVLYLNDNFQGGGTRFILKRFGMDLVREVPARRGSVLCFFHGEHPLSLLHEGALVTAGTKYIVRSEVLYKL